jgi:D-glycero-D-manno-heptose 1,7-bisphosphate phosphatase
MRLAADRLYCPRCYDYEVISAGNAIGRDVRTVFLDRDGVLNEKAPEGEYVWRWQHFRILDGVPDAIAQLNHAGIRVIVVTNQRGVALGLYNRADVAALHAEFQKLLGEHGARIDAFYVCPHGHGDCNCRKPLPGLFEQAAAEFPEIRAQSSVMIGDSLVDIEFGRGLGMKTILIGDPDRHASLGTQASPDARRAAALADLMCSSLVGAVETLLYR